METVADFILGASKITADGDCSHEIICVPLFVGVKPKDTTKSKIREGRMYYFQQ